MIRLIDRKPWGKMTPEDLREFAAEYVGFATNEMSPAEELDFTLTEQFPVSMFLDMPENWQDFFDTEVRENSAYDEEFEESDYDTPIIISLENDTIIIWDGWHRISCSVVRGDECMTAIVGRKKEG